MKSGDCWNRIGVRGDGSCPELERHVHCHNCAVYSAGAQSLLDRPISSTDLVESTRHFARPKDADEPGTQTVLIFRVASEWLALPMSVLAEIVGVRAVHSLPHKRGGAVLGVTNVRGELLVCVSLTTLLGLTEESAAGNDQQRTSHKRLLVIRRQDVRAVCPADDVDGIHRVHPWELTDLPLTIGKAAARHSSAVIMWRDHTVGLLDEKLLFTSLQRSLS